MKGFLTRGPFWIFPGGWRNGAASSSRPLETGFWAQGWLNPSFIACRSMIFTLMPCRLNEDGTVRLGRPGAGFIDDCFATNVGARLSFMRGRQRLLSWGWTTDMTTPVPPTVETSHGIQAIKDRTTWFGAKHVLKDISMAIKPRQVTPIIGPSGSENPPSSAA